MGFSPSLALYHILGPVMARGRENSPQTAAWPRRPAGRLMWIHAPRHGDLNVVLELIGQLADIEPDLWFLLTTRDGVPDDLPDQCFHSHLPVDTKSAMRAFLDHWQPDQLVWTSGELYPALIFQASSREIPMLLLDTGAAIDTSRGWRLLPGLKRKTLRRFREIHSGDEATTLALISAGARSDAVQTTGVLEHGIVPPPVNEAEWVEMAAAVATRPVWLAAEIDLEELGSILAAHQQTLRRSHRLLLIIVPADVDTGPAIKAALNRADISFSQRSTGGEPDRNNQVYLADTEDEMGLWYRLAPVTFVGQTLAGNSSSGPNPMDAACLGSVVLHGPKLSPYQVAFQRLSRAGASRPVAHMGELALAVEGLLSPDRAALMANAAWQITSAGAEVMEKTVEVLSNRANRVVPET